MNQHETCVYEASPVNFAASKARRLRDAADLARAHAEERKRQARKAWEIADEADAVAIDAESDADDWEDIVNGDMTFEELRELNDLSFSFEEDD